MFNKEDEPNRRRHKKADEKKKRETYPWEYDEDVIRTGKIIETGEGITKSKLSYEAVKCTRGRDWTARTGAGAGDPRAEKAP